MDNSFFNTKTPRHKEQEAIPCVFVSLCDEKAYVHRILGLFAIEAGQISTNFAASSASWVCKAFRSEFPALCGMGVPPMRMAETAMPRQVLFCYPMSPMTGALAVILYHLAKMLRTVSSRFAYGFQDDNA